MSKNELGVTPASAAVSRLTTFPELTDVSVKFWNGKKWIEKVLSLALVSGRDFGLEGMVTRSQIRAAAVSGGFHSPPREIATFLHEYHSTLPVGWCLVDCGNNVIGLLKEDEGKGASLDNFGDDVETRLWDGEYRWVWSLTDPWSGA